MFSMHSITCSTFTWQLIIKVPPTANYKSGTECHLAFCIISLPSILAQDTYFYCGIALIFQLNPKLQK